MSSHPKIPPEIYTDASKLRRATNDISQWLNDRGITNPDGGSWKASNAKEPSSLKKILNKQWKAIAQNPDKTGKETPTAVWMRVFGYDAKQEGEVKTEAPEATAQPPAKGILGRTADAVKSIFVKDEEKKKTEHIDPTAIETPRGHTTRTITTKKEEAKDAQANVPPAQGGAPPAQTAVNTALQSVPNEDEKREAVKALQADSSIEAREALHQLEKSTRIKPKQTRVITNKHNPPPIEHALKENKHKINTVLNAPSHFDKAYDKKTKNLTRDISSKLDNVFKKKKFYE